MKEKKPRSFKAAVAGIIALVIAVVISWYVPFLCLHDIDEHYPNGDTSVRITSTGEKYHLSSCSYLHSSSIKTTLENASAKGYGRCSRCDPPKFISVEDYYLAKAEQPLVPLIIVIPLLCVLIAALSVFLVGTVLVFLGNLFDIFDLLPNWFYILIMLSIYITTVIQGYRMIIIW